MRVIGYENIYLGSSCCNSSFASQAGGLATTAGSYFYSSDAERARSSRKLKGLEGARLALVVVLPLLLFSRRRPTKVGVSLRTRDAALEHAVGRCLASSAVRTAYSVPRLTLAAKSVFCGSNIDSVRTVFERPRIAIEDRAKAVCRRGKS